MKTTIMILTGTVALLALIASTARADLPNGVFQLTFSGVSQILDPFDDFDECDTLLGVTGCLALNLTPNGKGMSSGTATFEFFGALSGLLTGPAVTKLRCKQADPPRPLCKAALKIDLAGAINGLQSEIRSNIKGTIDQTGFFSGDGSVKVCIQGADPGKPGKAICDKAQGSFTHDSGTGVWTLTMTITSVDGKKLEGNATTSLGFIYDVRGKYSDKSDESKLKLKGADGASKGSKISMKGLTTSGGSVTGGAVKYKVLGNKGEASALSGP